MNAPEKILDRSRFLGGSDAAGIVKQSPWETPLTVYLWKIGEPTPDMIAEKAAKQKLFDRGKREEPRIIDDLIADYGVKVTKRSPPTAPNRYADPEHSFLSAEVDFEWEITAEIATRHGLPKDLVGTIQNGEAKSSHIFAVDQFGDAESEDVPVHYATQAMHGLMVTGRRLCMFAVKHGFDITLYWVWRDDETIAMMRPVLVNFWHRNVLARVAPEAIRLPDIIKLFRRAPASVVEASEEILPILEDLERAKQQVTAAEEAIEEYKFLIGKFMLGEAAIEREVKPRGGLGDVKPTASAQPGKHLLMAGAVPLLAVTLQEQTRLDSDRIKKEYPEVAAECSKEISFFKFERPRKKR